MTEHSSKLEQLRKLKPGEVLVYHRGFLLEDRFYSMATMSVGEIAYKAYEEGRIHLLQRRLTRTVFEYLAIGRTVAAAKSVARGRFVTRQDLVGIG